MTGQELFRALSFVDERYIAEAETARLGRNIPWMKVLSVAACLCILTVGAFALDGITDKHAETEAAAPEAVFDAAPEEAPAAAPEAAPEAAPREEEAEAEAVPEAEAGGGLIPPYAAEEAVPAEELPHISYARLRVTNLGEDGSFTAIVEETNADTNLFEVGMQVTVMVDSTKVPGADAEVQNDLRVLHTDAQIEIEDGAYDEKINTLYVTEVILLCRDGQ